jgi:cell division protein YceG involved in septum cleavage
MKVNACKMRIVLVLIMICAVMLTACAAPASVVVVTPPPQEPAVSTSPTVEPTATPVSTTSPEVQETEQTEPPETAGIVVVRDGDTLERDIIPQICAVFDLDEGAVKAGLAQAKNRLIGDKPEGFRRMEGIIVPGEYAVTDETLSDYIAVWVQQAEERFDSVAAHCTEKNGLKTHEQLTLASIVEWECIGNAFEREAAAAFLNRLDDRAKLRSCATTEYALGYQRPYLTSDDISVKSAYNTYQVKGLPPGPICALDDNSLAAGISAAVDKKIYYFFYDYAPGTMQFFSDYGKFKAAASDSVKRFEQTFDIGKYDKVDKRAVFGG